MSLDKKINEFEIIDNVCEDSLSVSNVKQFIKELKEMVRARDIPVSGIMEKLDKLAGKGLI